MPRTARAVVAGVDYHVINRGNARATVFNDESDFAEFLRLVVESTRRVPLDVFAYCLMPNHFHFVLRPHSDDGLARWMHWLMTSHVHRHRRRYASTGHIWQGRFKAFPIQSDGHLLAVIRYVERNALRASLVERAEHWRWGSLAGRITDQTNGLVTDPPIELPHDWVSRVNASDVETELSAIRRSVNRGTPFGDDAWTHATAESLGLAYTLRPPGRPSTQTQSDCTKRKSPEAGSSSD